VGTACYLLNRSPSSALGNKTPQEVWTGKEPYLTHLKVFGYDEYVHVPKENMSKMDKKAEKVSLLDINIDAGASLHINQPASQPRRARAFKAEERGAVLI
jgi:hypothetical protein